MEEPVWQKMLDFIVYKVEQSNFLRKASTQKLSMLTKINW